MTNRIATGLGAAAVALLLSACGGASEETLKSLSASCQSIEKATAAVCDCKAKVLGDNMDAKNLEIYAFYRAEWAKNASAYNAVELGSKAAEAKFSISEQDMNKISNEASLKYRAELKACEA